MKYFFLLEAALMELIPLVFDPQKNTGQHLPHREPSEVRFAQNQDSPPAVDVGPGISEHKLQHVTEALETYMVSLGVNLKFHIDERTDIVQVEVRDPDTDKLIRKIPADEILELAASMEKMVGLLVDKTL